MDEVPEARTLSDAALREMLAAVETDWVLREAEPVERGFCCVYRLVVAADSGNRELYLKASPDGEPWGIPTEARLQALLAATIEMPVPEVLGVVDDAETVPTPYYVMAPLPGEELPYERVSRLDDGALRRLARDTGRYLAALHGVPAPDRFGHVRHGGASLSGDAPSGDPASLTVGDAHDAWPAYLRTRVDRALDRHADSRFSDLTADLRAWFEERIEALDGSFEPVLGRNDHGLHNLLIEPDTGAVTGMLDWGYTLCVPAAYDAEFAVYLYGGAFMAGLPDVPDRRGLVREAMRTGYTAVAPGVADDVLAPDPVYEAVAMCRLMNDFHHLALPDGTESAVADRLAVDVRRHIEP